MIKNFRYNALSNFFIKDIKAGINPKLHARLTRILDRLDASTTAEDMNLPGYGFHKLSGNRKNTWSVKVSANWRVTFKFIHSHAYDVNLEDYH